MVNGGGGDGPQDQSPLLSPSSATTRAGSTQRENIVVKYFKMKKKGEDGHAYSRGNGMNVDEKNQL